MTFRLLLVAALSSFALVPLATDHFFASSDGLYHVYRSIEVYRCLQSGVLICRWMPDQFLGYGTPLLNLYSPAVYYYIAGFHALGLGWINATKASMVVFMLFSGIAAYGYALDFLSRRAALFAAVVYVYVPYHLVNAYYRGDLPEFFAMAWFPAILWAFGRIVRPGTLKQRFPYVVAAAVCYAGLILTHNLSAFIYTGLLVLYCLFLLIRGIVEGQWNVMGTLRPASLLIGASLVAYGLSAYLSFPALLEKHLIQLEGLLYVSHADHFPTLQQIMPNKIIHIYGIIFPESPEYAYKMGLVQVLIGGLGAIAALVFFKRFPFRARGEAVISIFVFCIAFWFTRPGSLWAWDNIPLLPYTQFPWRFLLLMALPTSVLGGFIVDLAPARWRTILATILIAFTIFTNTLGLRPIMANQVDGDIDLAESTRFELMYKLLGTTVAGEYIPRGVKEKPSVSPEALAIVLGGESPDVHVPTSDPRIEVKRLEKGSNHQVLRSKGDVAGRVVLNTVFFPGWRATLDGRTVAIEVTDPEGLIALQVPAGDHEIQLFFENTRVRTAGELVSLAALAVCIVLLGYSWGRPRWPSVEPLRFQMSRPTLLRTGLLVGIVGLFPFAVLYYRSAYRPPPLAQHLLKINLSDTLMLLGYDMRFQGRLLGRTESVPPGSTIDLSTYWQDISTDPERVARTKPYARLSNIDEQNWDFAVEASRSTVGADGKIFRSDLKLQVPTGLPPGVYQIDLGAFTRDGRPMGVRNMELVELLPTQGSIRVGPLQVKPGGGVVTPLAVPSGANFENKARLESLGLSVGLSDRRSTPIGITIDPGNALARTKAGDTLQIDLLWRSLQNHPGRYVVSASLEDEQGFKWAVRDSEPVDNLYPSWMWSADELVRDQLRVPVPAETPPGRYRLQLKLLAAGKPLSVLDAAGSPAGGFARLIDIDLGKTEAQARERDVVMTERRRVRITDDLEIVGNNIGRDEVTAGDALEVGLVWRATRDIRKAFTTRLSLIGRDGKPIGQVTAPTAGAANPTNDWERGDIFRGQYRLQVNRSAPTGEARLMLELLEAGVERPAASVEIDKIGIKKREGRAADITVTTRVDKVYGGQARLVGFNLSPGTSVPQGQDTNLDLALVWRTERPMDVAYTVFTQLIGPDGKVAAQHDGQPDDGNSPTTGWHEGEDVADVHRIALPKTLVAGEYRLIVGLYDPRDGKRLDLAPDQNFLELGKITVGR